MKRTTLYIVTFLAAALALGMLAGCTSESDKAKNALKDALKKMPAYTSVTVDVEESSTPTAKDASDETISSTTVYKFDKSSGTLKTSAEAEIGSIQFAYYTDGGNAVFVTDGPIYSGTTEQFDLDFADGVETYVKNTVGDLNTLIDCTDTAKKEESNGLAIYTLNLNVKKYAESDETLKVLQEYDPIKEAVATITIDSDGTLGSIDLKTTFEKVISVKNLYFKDYNATAVGDMPEATKTFEEMQADEQAKLDELFGDDESADDAK